MISILAKLPMKSLLRFKCVCKSWYDLIKSPTFIIRLHLNRSDYTTTSDHKDHVVSLYFDVSILTTFIPFLSYDSFEFSSNLSAQNPDFQDCNVSIRGSCNWLLCLKAGQRFYVMKDSYSEGLAFWLWL